MVLRSKFIKSKDTRSGCLTQWLLQNSCEFRITIRDEVGAFCQGWDHVAEGGKWLVDVLRFVQHGAFRSGLTDFFATCSQERWEDLIFDNMWQTLGMGLTDADHEWSMHRSNVVLMTLQSHSDSKASSYRRDRRGIACREVSFAFLHFLALREWGIRCGISNCARSCLSPNREGETTCVKDINSDVYSDMN